MSRFDSFYLEQFGIPSLDSGVYTSRANTQLELEPDSVYRLCPEVGGCYYTIWDDEEQPVSPLCSYVPQGEFSWFQTGSTRYFLNISCDIASVSGVVHYTKMGS